MSTMVSSGVPHTHVWSREDFYLLLEKGVLAAQKVELVEGEIVDMPAQLNVHAAAIDLTATALRAVFGQGHWVRVQNTLDLSPYSAVDPDLAVIVGNPRKVTRNNPTTALLVVEVSESTLDYDRGKKGSLYARCGIADYWVVNLVDWRLEVYRHPAPDAAQVFDFGYASRMLLNTSAVVTPLAAPQAVISVSELFPLLGQATSQAAE